MKLTFNVIERCYRGLETYHRYCKLFTSSCSLWRNVTYTYRTVIVIVHSSHKSLDICQFQRKCSSRWIYDKKFWNTIWTNDLNECLVHFVKYNINFVKDLLNSWNIHHLTFTTTIFLYKFIFLTIILSMICITFNIWHNNNNLTELLFNNKNV